MCIARSSKYSRLHLQPGAQTTDLSQLWDASGKQADRSGHLFPDCAGDDRSRVLSIRDQGRPGANRDRVQQSCPISSWQTLFRRAPPCVALNLGFGSAHGRWWSVVVGGDARRSAGWAGARNGECSAETRWEAESGGVSGSAESAARKFPELAESLQTDIGGPFPEPTTEPQRKRGITVYVCVQGFKWKG